MNIQSSIRFWGVGCMLACICISRAAGSAPEDEKVVDEAEKAAPAPALQSQDAIHKTVAETPEVACPCVGEYADAVRAFNERAGNPLTTWLRCEVAVSGTGGLIGYATKADAPPSDWVTVILVSKGRWGYGRGIVRRCEAWMYKGLAGDWGRPPLGAPTHGGHDRLSESEVQSCTQLIKATASCPD